MNKIVFLLIPVLMFSCENNGKEKSLDEKNKSLNFILSMEEFFKYPYDNEKRVELFNKMTKSNRMIFLKEFLNNSIFVYGPNHIIKFLKNGIVVVDNISKKELKFGKWKVIDEILVLEVPKEEFDDNRIVFENYFLKLSKATKLIRKLNKRIKTIDAVFKIKEKDYQPYSNDDFTFYLGYLGHGYEGSPKIEKYCKKNGC